MKGERTAAYIRVSTQEQKIHGLSLDAQVQKLTEYAKAHNLDIVEWYKDEGVSGRKLISKRPELQRMISDAEERKFTRIIFIKLDRFFRSVAEYHECMKRITPALWTATEEKYDLTTANGRAFVNMKLTIAELEADQTGERIKLVNEYKVRSGMPVVPTRCLPFCFANENRKIVKRNEAAIMDLIQYAEDYKSIHGGMTYINKKYSLGLTYRAVANVLRNPMLCGQYRDNPNYCEPYITRERFDALQKGLERNTRGETKYDYIFAGLIICPSCGRKLNGSQHHSTSGGYNYRYTSYRCQKHRASNQCDFTACVFESKMESLMIEYIGKYLNDYHISVNGTPEAGIRQDVDALRAELSRINYAWEKGRLLPEDYDKKYDDIIARIEQAEAYNRSLDKTPRIPESIEGNWLDYYTALSNSDKAAFWKSFVSRIDITWESGKFSRKEIKSIEFY